jgi:DNA-binding GntR family transcriptional regulator
MVELSAVPKTSAISSMTKAEAAFRLLRASIEEGVRKPGEPLRIADLVSELGMSPTPIREALRMLQVEGLVEHEPHRGMTVAQYPVEKVEEVYALRLAIEPLATELAAGRLSPEALAEIELCHAALVSSVEAGGPHNAALNADWHQAIYRAAGSSLVSDFVARLWASVPVEAVWVSARASESLAEHAEINSALRAGKGAKAATLMKHHIAAGADEITARMAALQDARLGD